MFGDLMGNMEEKQLQMKAKLQAIVLKEEVENIEIIGNGAREIQNISIDVSYLTPDKKEELEDILVVTMNNLLQKIAEEESKESQSMISDLLPPGMSSLFGS